MDERKRHAGLGICDLGPSVTRSWIQFWEGEDERAAQAAVAAARKGAPVASLDISPRRPQSSPGGGTS